MTHPATEWDHFSASQFKMFAGAEGCPRRWAAAYLCDVDRPEGEPLWFGSMFHLICEDALTARLELDTLKSIRDGRIDYPFQSSIEDLELPNHDPVRIKKCARLVVNGLESGILNPDVHSLVEHRIHHDPDKSNNPLFNEVEFLGFPLHGYIDQLILPTKDQGARPIPTIVDHKTTSAWKWALTPAQLRTDIQMICYAYWTFENQDAIYSSIFDEIRLRHNQFNKKNYNVRSRSIVVSRDHVYRFVEKLKDIAVEMVEIREKIIEESRSYTSVDVDHDVGDRSGPCGAYGGCFLLDTCNQIKYSVDSSSNPFEGIEEIDNLTPNRNEKMSRLQELMNKNDDGDADTADNTSLLDPSTASKLQTLARWCAKKGYEVEDFHEFFSRKQLKQMDVEDLKKEIWKQVDDVPDDAPDDAPEVVPPEVVPPEAPEDVDPPSPGQQEITADFLTGVSGIGASVADGILGVCRQVGIETLSDLRGEDLEDLADLVSGMGKTTAQNLQDALDSACSIDDQLDDVPQVDASDVDDGELADDDAPAPDDAPDVDDVDPPGAPLPSILTSRIPRHEVAEDFDVLYLEDVIQPYAAASADAEGVPHYLLIDYGKGAAHVASRILSDVEEYTQPGTILIVDRRQPATDTIVETIAPYFDLVLA